VLNVVWAIHEPLTAVEKIVLLRLADFAADDGGSLFPGVDRIAYDCRLSRRAVIKALKRLEALGFVVTLRRGAGKRSSVRRLDIGKLCAAADAAGNGAHGARSNGAPRALALVHHVHPIRQ
jgi:hypothetical protein